MIGAEPTFSASEFVAVFNQSVNFMYPSVRIVGEISNFRISRNRWVYFDLKDELASVKFFGTVGQLPGPLEDGLTIEVQGSPRLHPQYGFSVTIQEITVTGEGSIKKAQDLLAKKLFREGLFDPSRKRALPYPPERVGVISSRASAGLADFRKIIDARWGRVEILLFDTQVQGADSPKQIVEAVSVCNQMSEPPEVLVLIRGGGSVDDLSAYSTEAVVRAVAGSRIPTLVAIGHETDESLAELVADRRASTPSNAGEILVPDRTAEKAYVVAQSKEVDYLLKSVIKIAQQDVTLNTKTINDLVLSKINTAKNRTKALRDMVALLDPKAPLKRGYALARDVSGRYVSRASQVRSGQSLSVEFADGIIKVKSEG